jgi:hypothetical protein
MERSDGLQEYGRHPMGRSVSYSITPLNPFEGQRPMERSNDLLE